MSSPLQKYPSGLLEALNLKTLGQMPDEFGSLVAPVVESFDFYAADRLQSSEATAIGAFNQTVYDIVTSGPQLVRTIGFQFVEGAAAGTFMHWALGFRIPHAGSVVSWVGNGSFLGIAAGASRYGGIQLGRPVLVPPGGSVCGFFTSDAAGADHSFRVNKLSTTLAP